MDQDLAHARQVIAAARLAEAEHEDLITVQEYAAWMRLHVQTVYSAIRYGRMRYPVVRATAGKRAPIRIRVPRGSIQARTHAE